MQAPVPHSLAASSAAPSMPAAADPASTSGSDASDSGSPKQQTNLFINYLPPDLDDAGLRHSFSPFGEIENCKVMLDLNTGESRCFGFVKFKTRDQANRALQAMNGQKLGNKTLVVKFADTTNDSIGTPSNNIYVKNLSPTMSLTELEGLFSAYGKIQECKVLKDAYTNQSRGMAFVRYTNVDEARSAIQSLNNYAIPGADKPLVVKFADTEEERTQRKQKQQRRRMGQVARYGHYMEGAAPAFAVPYAPQMPGAYPTPFATPVSFFPFAAAAPFSHDGPHAAPLAAPPVYVQQPHAHASHSHSSHPHPHPHPHSHSHTPSPAGPTAVAAAAPATSAAGGGGSSSGLGAIPADCNLFVYNLPENADDALLVRLFSPYGTVVSVRVQRDKLTHAPKGYGFVQMASPPEALAALQALNGAKLGDKILSVSFKK